MNIKKNMYIRTTLIFLFLFLFLLKFYIPLGLRSIISYSFLFIIFLVIFSGKIIYNKIPKNYFYVNEKIFLIIFYGINIFLFILYIMMANSFKQKDELISFQNNRPFIYQYIANSINSNNYQDAIDESKKYRKFNDINIINYQKIAEKRKANLEKAEILKNKELKKQDAIQKAIIERENKEKALKESIEMGKRMDEINIQKEKKAHFQYLKNSEQKWINIIKDDEKTNVSFVIKDMAQAYSGLMELYPNNQHYKQRGKYWIDSNNEEIQHQNNIDRVYNKNILTMEKYLKTHLNNPRSLEIVSEKYYDHIDEVTIEIIYRATNSYNAIITDRMLTRFNLKTGKVVSASLSSLNE